MTKILARTDKPGFFAQVTLALAEGLAVGGIGSFTPTSLPLPLWYALIGLYTAWRAGRTRLLFYLAAVWAGATAAQYAAAETGSLLTALWTGGRALVVAGTSGAAYFLTSGIRLFAAYGKNPRAWGVTVTVAAWTALFTPLLFPHPLAVLLAPLLGLCFLPLWAVGGRLLHAVLFALVYLVVDGLLGRACGFPDRMGSLAPAGPFLWLAVFFLALVPELLGYFYPERRHDLDSLPVMTPTLSTQEKLAALKEVFFLAIGFLGLVQERFPVLDRWGGAGRYLMGLGCLGEAGLAAGAGPVAGWWGVILFGGGLLLELGAGNYGVAAIGMAIYAGALVAGWVWWGDAYSITVIAWAILLFFLAGVLWRGKPRESKTDLERWKQLNRL